MNNKMKLLYWCGSLLFCIGLLTIFIPIYFKVPWLQYVHVKTSSLIINFLNKGSGFDIASEPIFSGSYLQLSIALPLLSMACGLILIFLSNRSNHPTTKKCSNCGISFTTSTKHCPKCGKDIREIKKNYGLYFRLAVVVLAIIGSCIEAAQWESFVLPNGHPYILDPGWGFRITFSMIYGLIFFIILIIVPKFYSFFKIRTGGNYNEC